MLNSGVICMKMHEIVSGENALLVCHLSKGVMENANCPDFYGDMELKTL